MNQYVLLPLLAMDLFAFVGLMLFFFTGNSRVNIRYAVLLFVCYLFVDTLIVSLFTSSVSSFAVYVRMCRVVMLYAFFFVAIPEIFDFDYAFRFYSKVVYIVTIAIMVQYVLYFLFHYDLNLLIPGLRINYGSVYETSDSLMRAWHVGASIGLYRPCTFFLEPAHQAQYCLPWIAMALTRNPINDEKKWLHRIIFVSTGVVLTTSSLGIVGCALLWMYYIASITSTNSGKFRNVVVMISTLFAIVVFVVSQDGISQQVLERFLSLMSDEGSSTTLRLFRGIACFAQMDIPYKFFGCGYGNITEFLQEHNITTIYDKNLEVIAYMNGLSTVLCGLGILGLVSYIYMILGSSKDNKSGCRNILLFTLLIVMATSSVFHSATYFMLMSFLQAKKDKICLSKS